jgi:hypothetical protein
MAPEHCKLNFYVIVTSVPDELIAAWSKRNPFMFGDARGAKVRRFVTASTPVRVWYNDMFYNWDGTPCRWFEGVPFCEGGGHIRFGAVSPGGQVKLLHPWPGQNPPPLRRGDG